MGRKPLPEDQKKKRCVYWLTLEQQVGVEVALGMRAVTIAEREWVGTIPKDASIGDTVMVPLAEVYLPSMRECGICGKDYDGNLHDKCPHEHVANNQRRK